MVNDEDRAFLEHVRKGLEADKKQSEIASELGISPATLQQKCARLGYRISKRLLPIKRAKFDKNVA